MNCNPIARWYRWLEYLAFGRALERRRFAFLDLVSDSRRALILGDGDGRFLAKFAQIHLKDTPPRGENIDYIDLSDRMLELAQKRGGTGQIRYRHGDALTLPIAHAEYDLVVTHFFLDCFDERDLEVLVARITDAVKPGGRWLISEFRADRWWMRAFVAILYAFFRVTTGLRAQRLTDHRPLLARHGFVLQREETARFGLLASELWLFRGAHHNGAFSENESR